MRKFDLPTELKAELPLIYNVYVGCKNKPHKPFGDAMAHAHQTTGDICFNPKHANKIVLNGWYPTWILLHEYAHLMTPIDLEEHGPEFQKNMITMRSKYPFCSTAWVV